MYFTRLPARDEMLRRLKEVSDDARIVRYFYTELLEFADLQLPGGAIAHTVASAVKKVNPLLPGLLTPHLQDWVEKLIDDPKAKNDALNMIKETMPELYKER